MLHKKLNQLVCLQARVDNEAFYGCLIAAKDVTVGFKRTQDYMVNFHSIPSQKSKRIAKVPFLSRKVFVLDWQA